jgi:hypothetical protein
MFALGSRGFWRRGVNDMTESEHADTEFKPVGENETTEDAEYEEHDFGVGSSEGRGAEGTGTYPVGSDSRADD